MSAARPWARTRSGTRVARLRRALRLLWFAATDQERLLFRPRARDRATPAALGLEFDEHMLPSKDARVRLWWVPGPTSDHASRDPLVLVLSGALGNMSYEASSLLALHRLGATVCLVDYPGFGASTGSASARGCQEAARAAWRFIGERGYEPAAVVIFGRSFGTAVAVWLAANVACPRALVLHSGFSRLSELVALYLPRVPPRLIRWACRIRLDAERWARDVGCEVLLLHGTHDRLVPIEHARRLAEQFRHGCRFIELPGDHFTDGWHHDAGAKAAVRELLNSRRLD